MRLHLACLLCVLQIAWITGCASVREAATIPPAPEGVHASRLYDVSVNGKPVFVYPCATHKVVGEDGQLLPDRHQAQRTAEAAFATFDIASPVEVVVKVRGGPALHTPLKTATIRPQRHAIKPVIEGDTIRFTLDKPCKLSIEPNDTIAAPLMLFVNEPEARRPEAGASGVRWFGPGVHTLGFHDKIKSNETIYIAAGAVVRGHIWGENVSNVRVLGRGVLDASLSPSEGASPGTNEFGKANRHMRWFKCQDILIEGITMLDSPSWTIEINHCDRVTVRNVNIITSRGSSDGIDVVSSENVAVDRCFLRTRDDTLNVKGLTDLGYPAKDGKYVSDGVRKPARNISFTNCVVWNDRAHALMIGPETRTTEISNITYRDIDIIHALSVHAMAIFSADAAEIRNVLYENIRVEDGRVMEFMGVRIGKSYTTADATQGSVTGIVYRNIRVDTPGLHSTLLADPPGTTITNVLYENIDLAGEKGTSLETMRVHTRGVVKDVTVR